MMKLRKRIWAIYGLCLLIALLAGSSAYCSGVAYAEPEEDENCRIFDYADLFTEEEEAELQRMAEEYGEQEQIGFAILTTAVNETGSTSWLAESFYYDKGYSFGYGDTDKGVLFVIDMDCRNFYIYYSEGCKPYFNDNEVEKMLDMVEDNIYSYQFFDAAQDFFNAVQRYDGENTGTKSGYDSGERRMLALVAAILALIPTLILAHSQRSKVTTTGRDYQQGTVRINAREDVFIRMSTHTVRRDNGGHSGGGGGGGHSRGGGGGRSSGSRGGGGGRHF